MNFEPSSLIFVGGGVGLLILSLLLGVWVSNIIEYLPRNIKTGQELTLKNILLSSKKTFADVIIKTSLPLLMIWCLILFVSGVSLLSLVYMTLTTGMYALLRIDLNHMLLPDKLTVPLIWLGLISSSFDLLPVKPSEAVQGAVTGYFIPWGIFWFFKLSTGKEGFGYGDFKLMALIGCFLGPASVSNVLLGACLSGILVGSIIKRGGSEGVFPFGPHLIVFGVISLLFPEYDKLMNSFWIFL